MPAPPDAALARGPALEAYRRARDYVDRELVRLTPRRRDPEGKVLAARRFNARLGDPQRAWPAVQVAGTSGKGSVATLVAGALAAAGLRTGLHVSPYLQVLSEKSWLDGRYCAPTAIARAVEALRPAAEELRRDPDCPASVHGLAALALSNLVFAERGLDLAVIETGLGGRYDLVQGLRRELCVISDLALDHVEALGPTLERIAWHKAGILEAGVPGVAIRGPGWEVLEDEARRVGAPLEAVRPEEVVVARRLAAQGPSSPSSPAPPAGERPLGGWTELVLRLPTLGEVEVVLPGTAPYLARNAALAGVALDRLARAGRPLRPEHLRTGFALRQPGRCEVMQEGPRVVLDGAHNPHKLAALVAGLRDGDGCAGDGGVARSAGGRGRAGPVRRAGGRPGPVVVLGASGRRAPDELVRGLLALAPQQVLTAEVELYGKEVVGASALASAARRAGLPARAVPCPEDALEDALARAASSGAPVVVTGSMYLIGRLRERWHPWEEVLLQGTSWPRAPRTASPSPP